MSTEEVYDVNSYDGKRKHYEDYPAFQEYFFNDVTNVYKSFIDICNPFDQERLMTLHNGKVMSSEIQNCLSTLLDVNEERYRIFCKHRLELCDVPLTCSEMQCTSSST